MASPKIPNQKSKYDALNIRLAKYVALIQSVYDTLNNEAAQIAMRTGYDGEKEFKFSDYPQTKESVLQLQKDYAQSLSSIIYSGTSEEWKNSNLIQDLIARNAINFYTSTHNGKKNKVYYQVNSDALKAFQQRVDKGMNLSQKVWDQSGNYKQELEYAISTAIEKGTSAVTLSKQISKYLRDFPQLQKDYSEKYGKAVDCHDCEYRSMRLARSEINMAYRRAEELRWQQMDFVIGKEIKLSKRHEPHSDICDDLAGKYPKDFDWTGWHPNDMCYVIPILKSEQEFWADEDSPEFDQTKPINHFPQGFTEYVGRNLDKFTSANARGTLSYWLKDNDDVRGCVLLMGKAKKVGDEVENIAQTIANAHGAKVSAISYKDFNTLYRKVTSAENGVKIGVGDITDSVSTTIVSEKDLDAIIKDLSKDSHWLRTKVQAGEDFYGYSGNIINLTMDNGVVAEIQVNTPKMIFAKEAEANARNILGDEVYDKIAKDTGLEGGLGGKLYEQIRTLDKIKDAEKVKELCQQSKDYYVHFGSSVKPKAASAIGKVEYQPPHLKEVQSDIDDDVVEYNSRGEVKTIKDFFNKGGLTEEEAQKKLNQAIANSDIYMSIDGNTLLKKIIKGDGYFKSSIETGKGTFKTIGDERAIKERKMFGMNENCSFDEYPKYGFLSAKDRMSYKDIVGWGYGDTYVRFKPSMKGKATFTIGDSYDGNKFYTREQIEKLKDYSRIESEFGNDEEKAKQVDLLKMLDKLGRHKTAWYQVSPASPLNNPNIKSLLSLNYGGKPYENLGKIIDDGIDSIANHKSTYVECQMYGKVSINDVASIEVSSIKQKSQLEKTLKKMGLNIEVVPCKYNTKLMQLENAFTDYSDGPSKLISSLTDEDLDNLGDFYINGICKRFAEKDNLFWKKIKMPEHFTSLLTKVSDGAATMSEKRDYCKLYFQELRKKGDGVFPKVWWESYKPKLGGWTSDVLQKDLLSRSE